MHHYSIVEFAFLNKPKQYDTFCRHLAFYMYQNPNVHGNFVLQISSEISKHCFSDRSSIRKTLLSSVLRKFCNDYSHDNGTCFSIEIQSQWITKKLIEHAKTLLTEKQLQKCIDIVKQRSLNKRDIIPCEDLKPQPQWRLNLVKEAGWESEIKNINRLDQYKKWSGGRTYNSLVMLPKSVKKVLHKGRWNSDIKACYPNALLALTTDLELNEYKPDTYRDFYVELSANDPIEKIVRSAASFGCSPKLTTINNSDKLLKANILCSKEQRKAAILKFGTLRTLAQHIPTNQSSYQVNLDSCKDKVSFRETMQLRARVLENVERRFIDALELACKNNGIEVVCNEYDGIITEQRIPMHVFEEARSSHRDFRLFELEQKQF